MPRLPYGHVSEFVKIVLPNAPHEEHLHFQGRVDDLLDVIDRIHERLTREGYYRWERHHRCMVPWKDHTIPPDL